jgi:hypothetical protein
MAMIVETLDAAGNLVEHQDPAASPLDAAAPLPEAPVGDSAPPDPAAAPLPEVPAGDSAPPGPSDSEEDDPDSREVPRGVQKRFDTLTRQREEARREAQALQQRYDRELAELRGQLAMQTRLLQGEAAPAAALPLHQQPEPVAEDYASEQDWFKAVRAWDKAQLKAELVREQHQQVAQAEEQRQWQAMEAREQVLRQQYADYDAQIRTLEAKGLTPQVYQALLHHELGPDLGYYLAQHPEELQRLAPLPPLHVWREFGKLETRLPGMGQPPPAAPSVVSSSSPKPAPLTPVGSGGSGAPAPALDDPNVPQRDWETAAERQYPGIFSRRR